jgi:NAD(P)H dehydrogenase (quinone)
MHEKRKEPQMRVPGVSGRIGVTGAGGKTGRQVIRALAGRGHRVRALVRRGADHDLYDLGVESVVEGDLLEPADLLSLAECDAVYHIPPNMCRDETAIAKLLVDACAAKGVRRLVYHSVLHPQTEAMPHHWAKLRVEEFLLESGLEATFLQPAPYMQNLLPYLDAARFTGNVQFPYGAHVVLSMVDLRDVAAAAAVVLEEDGHSGGAYQLCSEEVRTQGEAWAALTARLGLDVPFASVPLAAWRQAAGQKTPLAAEDWLVKMFAYYEQHGLRGSSLPLRALLGRRPHDLASFADALLAPG